MGRRTSALVQLQPFPANTVFKHKKPVALPPGRAKARNIAGANRVNDPREYHRHAAGRLTAELPKAAIIAGASDISSARGWFRDRPRPYQGGDDEGGDHAPPALAMRGRAHCA